MQHNVSRFIVDITHLQTDNALYMASRCTGSSLRSVRRVVSFSPRSPIFTSLTWFRPHASSTTPAAESSINASSATDASTTPTVAMLSASSTHVIEESITGASGRVYRIEKVLQDKGYPLTKVYRAK